MPRAYQTYVTQIQNGFEKEQSVIDLLEKLSPVAASMSKMALEGLQAGMKEHKLNTQIQQTFGVNKRYASGVITFVAGEIKSASESYKRHIETLGEKIKSINETINHLNKRLNKHREYVKALEKYNLAIKYPEKTKSGKPKKVPVFKKKPEFDNACPINGYVHGKTYLQLARVSITSKETATKSLFRPSSYGIKARSQSQCAGTWVRFPLLEVLQKQVETVYANLNPELSQC